MVNQPLQPLQVAQVLQVFQEQMLQAELQAQLVQVVFPEYQGNPEQRVQMVLVV
jgi:hypothetical protein